MYYINILNFFRLLFFQKQNVALKQYLTELPKSYYRDGIKLLVDHQINSFSEPTNCSALAWIYQIRDDFHLLE